MKISQEIKDKVLNLHDKGLFDRQIAKEIGRSTTIIRKIRDEYSLLPYSKFKKEQILQKLIELEPLKLTDFELAKILNSTHKRIQYYRKTIDLPAATFQNKYKNQSDRIKGYMIRNTKFTAKRRGHEFNLHYSDFQLPEYCPLLGVKLTFRSESDGNDPFHASLDRIDNSKGYIKGNVIVLSKIANAMKNSANFEELAIFTTNITKLINFYKIQGALVNITDVFPNIKLMET